MWHEHRRAIRERIQELRRIALDLEHPEHSAHLRAVAEEERQTAQRIREIADELEALEDTPPPASPAE